MTNASVALNNDAPMASTYNGVPAAKIHRDLRARVRSTLAWRRSSLRTA